MMIPYMATRRCTHLALKNNYEKLTVMFIRHVSYYTVYMEIRVTEHFRNITDGGTIVGLYGDKK